MYDYSPLVSERDLFRDVRDMEWTQSSPATADDLLDGLSTTPRPMAESANFDDIGESSFHCEESLLMEEDGLTTPHFFDFSEVAEASFHEGDSLLRDLRVEPLGDSSIGQYGGGRNDDYDIRIVGEKNLKKMGAVEVQFELTFRDDLFRERKKMVEVKNLLNDAFEKMLARVKRDLRPGDIIRAAIHNDHLDLPVYVPCRPMEEMDAEAVMESLMTVLNSEEDIPFDSSCRIDIGAIKYPRGGTRVKMSSIAKAIAQKRSIVRINNTDNNCLVRAVLVALAHSCKTHSAEFNQVKARHPNLTCGEILIFHQKCPLWYYKDLLKNHKATQDTLTARICDMMNITNDAPLTYAYIPPLEDFFGINLYVVSLKMGKAFS